MLEYMRVLSEVFKMAIVDIALPWARYVIPGLSGHTLRLKHTNTMKTMFEDIISEHKRDFQTDSKPRVRLKKMVQDCNSTAYT